MLLLSIGLFSCKKDNPIVPDMGYNYFPDQLGRFVTYDVDSFYYDDFNERIDSFKFQLKEKIESIYTDNQNRPTIRLERYIKYRFIKKGTYTYNDTLAYNLKPWILKDVWTENRTSATAEKVEENVRFIKLVFPVKEKQIWNGNIQNTNDEWDYKYGFFDVPRTIGNNYFDSVLQVTQMEDKLPNLISRQYYIEQYARNVGLVYKQVIDVKSQNIHQIPNFFQIPIMNRVTSGFQFTMTVNSYGIE